MNVSKGWDYTLIEFATDDVLQSLLKHAHGFSRWLILAEIVRRADVEGTAIPHQLPKSDELRKETK
jgi:hypothetical protein